MERRERKKEKRVPFLSIALHCISHFSRWRSAGGAGCIHSLTHWRHIPPSSKVGKRKETKLCQSYYFVMPFVLRQVTPVRLSRLIPTATAAAADDDDDDGNNQVNGRVKDDDDARQLVTNRTLSNCLRQLASVVSLANEIFSQCQCEADALNERTACLLRRLNQLQVQSAVESLDYRTVAIRKLQLHFFLFSFRLWLLNPSISCVCTRRFPFGVGRKGQNRFHDSSPFLRSYGLVLTASEQLEGKVTDSCHFVHWTFTLFFSLLLFLEFHPTTVQVRSYPHHQSTSSSSSSRRVIIIIIRGV